MARLKLSAEATALFKQGVSLFMPRWSCLELAVLNEWGGINSKDMAQCLINQVFTWFTKTKGELYVDELQELLEDGLASLNTFVDDGSIVEVACKLMSMHEECLEGNYESVQKLIASSDQPRRADHIKGYVSDSDSDSDNVDNGSSANGVADMMMVDAPEQTRTNRVQAQADPDGWNVVSYKKKKKRGKRN